MFKKADLQQNDTIFSYQNHLSEMKRKARIMKAKIAGYHASKWAIVIVLCFGLVTAGTLHTTAGNKKYKSQPAKHKNVYKTTFKTNKKVKARAGNDNKYGNSNTRARVNNSINVNTGGRSGGGGHAFVKRDNNGGKKNNRNNDRDKKVVKKKKVVRKNKKVVNNIDKSYTDNSYYNNEDNDEYNIDQKVTNKTTYKTKYHYPSDDCNNKCYDDYSDKGYYYSDDCDCYYKTKSKSETNIKISNNNDNYNDNYNEQHIDIRN